MKSKKSADSIKKEDYTTAGCSKEKFYEPEKCEIKITNLSESVPNQFYEEMSKKATKKAVCRFEEDYVEITFDSHLKGHLFANYLNNIAIGDTILKTSFLHKDCKKGIHRLDKNSRRNFRESLRPQFEFWEFSASEIAKKNIRHTLSCESYKTIECEESECDEASCIFYHSEMDRRRNPYSVPYGSMACKYISKVGTCNKGDECRFSHNDYECMFHPFEIYFKLCKDRKTRKQCFSNNPLCPYAHFESPETFFTRYWNDLVLFGTPLAVDFLVGAISKFNLINPAYKDTRIFMMGASVTFLHNVRKAVNKICRIHTLKHDFVGERDVVFECEPLLFGTPSKFLKRIGHLVVLPFTLIIVSQVDVLLSIRKERKALINFFARCQMPFSPPYVQTLFVADEYDADMQVKIKHYLSKNVKVITNPEHKVKFDHDVPCTPFALNALPKWLDTGSNPSQVYPFLSAEVAESMVENNKKKLANTPWFRRETFYSSDSSEFSDSSELTSSDTEDDRRSNRRR
ncbi:Zinc finger CCCH domain-containing protein 33 [Armadillidium vulgare]|nr:Zinc finger CCCH domain-containing protein 33 [Armadillidium vulgare]